MDDEQRDPQSILDQIQELLGQLGGNTAPAAPAMEPAPMPAPGTAGVAGIAEPAPMPAEPAVAPSPQFAPGFDTPAPAMATPPSGQAAQAYNNVMGLFAAYGQGPTAGRDTFGEGVPDNQRFGDAGNDWRVAPDSRPYLDPLLSGRNSADGKAILGGGRAGDLMAGAFGAVFDELGNTRRNQTFSGNDDTPDRYGRTAPTRQQFMDDVATDNLTNVRPERQANGDVRRVYAYEDGRTVAEPYWKAPEPPKVTPPVPGNRGPGGGGQQQRWVNPQTGASGTGTPPAGAVSAPVTYGTTDQGQQTASVGDLTAPKGTVFPEIIGGQKIGTAHGYDVYRDSQGNTYYKLPNGYEPVTRA